MLLKLLTLENKLPNFGIIEFTFSGDVNSSLMNFSCDNVDGNQLSVVADLMAFDSDAFCVNTPSPDAVVTITFDNDHSLDYTINSNASHRQVIAAGNFLKIYSERTLAIQMMQSEQDAVKNAIELARSLPSGIIS